MPRHVTLSAERRGPLSVYPAYDLAPLGVDVFVTDRFNGASTGPYDSLNLGDHVGDEPARVRHNRGLVADAAGVAHDRLVIVRQVHGTRVLRARDARPDDEADALVSDDDDVALAILVADCVPLALVEEDSGRICVVHAGWRGLAAGVIGAALREFRPERTHVFVGPAISAEGYQVGPEVAAHFADLPGVLSPDVEDRSRLDLRAVTLAHLLRAGVREERITLSREVTDGGEVFYSDRAQRPCGRFAVVARRAVA